MCGFVGALRLKPDGARVDPTWLRAMRDALVHRGPDGAGEWIAADGRVGLGHRRLAIVDLSAAGAQPMASADGTCQIAYNGELYNHAAVRPVLEAAGYAHRGRSDTETLGHALHAWGPEACHRFDGMFAFAWWDGRANRLWLVRDRLGIKPCYVTQADGWLLFASEIKALLRHPAVARDVDPVALSHYLTFLATPAPYTLFRDIWKLPAGHRLRADAGGAVAVERWWDPAGAAADPSPDPRAAAAELRTRLRGAITRQTMSDVPYGVFLSGGVDSTTNVALMREAVAGPLRTFNVAFRDHAAYNEDAPARQAAARYGTEHHEVVIGEAEAIGFLDDLIYHQDEPLADWVCIPLAFVSRLVRERDTVVVQVGEGSDEIFAGYDLYRDAVRRHAGVWRRLERVPAPLLRAAATLLGPAPLGGRWHRRAELLRRAGRGEEFFWGGAIAWVDDHKAALVRPGPAWAVPPRPVGPFAPLPFETLDSHAVVRHHVEAMRAARPASTFLDRLIYLELKQRLPELLLMRVDKMTMRSSIEGRVPFLDHGIVELAMSWPDDLKIRGGVGKWVLKEAVRGLVPDDVLDSPKRGFGAPVAEWLRGELGAVVADRFRRSAFRQRGFLHAAVVDRCLDEHRRGVRDHALRLWVLWNLAAWYDRWIAR